MSHQAATPEERFATIVEELLSYPGVTPRADASQSKNKFGASALKIHNKIFAMLVRGQLVLKLPRHRVDALTSTSNGEPFQPNPGRIMKEWVVLNSTSEEDWLPLAREAMEFVASQH